MHTLLHVPRHALLQRQGGRLTAPARSAHLAASHQAAAAAAAGPPDFQEAHPSVPGLPTLRDPRPAAGGPAGGQLCLTGAPGCWRGRARSRLRELGPGWARPTQRPLRRPPLAEEGTPPAHPAPWCLPLPPLLRTPLLNTHLISQRGRGVAVPWRLPTVSTCGGTGTWPGTDTTGREAPRVCGPGLAGQPSPCVAPGTLARFLSPRADRPRAETAQQPSTDTSSGLNLRLHIAMTIAVLFLGR